MTQTATPAVPPEPDRHATKQFRALVQNLSYSEDRRRSGAIGPNWLAHHMLDCFEALAYGHMTPAEARHLLARDFSRFGNGA